MSLGIMIWYFRHIAFPYQCKQRVCVCWGWGWALNRAWTEFSTCSECWALGVPLFTKTTWELSTGSWPLVSWARPRCWNTDINRHSRVRRGRVWARVADFTERLWSPINLFTFRVSIQLVWVIYRTGAKGKARGLSSRALKVHRSVIEV